MQELNKWICGTTGDLAQRPLWFNITLKPVFSMKSRHRCFKFVCRFGFELKLRTRLNFFRVILMLPTKQLCKLRRQTKNYEILFSQKWSALVIRIFCTIFFGSFSPAVLLIFTSTLPTHKYSSFCLYKKNSQITLQLIYNCKTGAKPHRSFQFWWKFVLPRAVAYSVGRLNWILLWFMSFVLDLHHYCDHLIVLFCFEFKLFSIHPWNSVHCTPLAPWTFLCEKFGPSSLVNYNETKCFDCPIS